MKTHAKHNAITPKRSGVIRKKSIKDVLIVVKVSRGLAVAIDAEGERVGLTRSAIVRGTLLDKFRHAMPEK